MSILSKLSSQVGDRSEKSNRLVALQCLADPALIEEIAEGLHYQDAPLVGDCAEVMTLVAEEHPEWVVPYAESLKTLLNHKATRVRWEAMHALALTAASAPQVITELLPTLVEKIRADTSVIVRDYATDAVAYYAATSKTAAEMAYPILYEALTLWEGKHAGHALKGLVNVAIAIPELRDELQEVANKFSIEKRAVVRKAAKGLHKALASSKAAG